MVDTREIAAEYRLSHWAQIMQERIESGLSIRAFASGCAACRRIWRIPLPAG
ncbi:MAG: hypothetical protein M0R40_04210 [Firmicutes bacterium]|nr:hypothetical protein [Bacillota bacterium]